MFTTAQTRNDARSYHANSPHGRRCSWVAGVHSRPKRGMTTPLDKVTFSSYFIAADVESSTLTCFFLESLPLASCRQQLEPFEVTSERAPNIYPEAATSLATWMLAHIIVIDVVYYISAIIIGKGRES
eukprot:796533-Prorocentrum_minimum.AAC.4